MAVSANAMPNAAWAGAIASPGREFASTELPPLAGALPENLQGTLYRNGPGCLERGGQRAGHWFDGDGAILAVRFAGGKASACYRYVRTAGYEEETRADRYLFPNYGQTAAGPFWNNWLRPVKNAANTSVLALPDKLLALWEGGWPHGLNLDDPITQGPESLGWLSAGQSFSAHPKRDPQTGELYNFGTNPGRNAELVAVSLRSGGRAASESGHCSRWRSPRTRFCFSRALFTVLYCARALAVTPGLAGA